MQRKTREKHQKEEEHTSVLETSRLVDDFLAIFACLVSTIVSMDSRVMFDAPNQQSTDPQPPTAGPQQPPSNQSRQLHVKSEYFYIGIIDLSRRRNRMNVSLDTLHSEKNEDLIE